jgi:hypothetical protein
MPLTGRFIAGQPCFDLPVAGPSSLASLTCQVDTFGDYELLLLPHIAQQANYVPGFFLANHRLLDGRTITTGRGTLYLVLPWTQAPRKTSLRIFRSFNVVGHPPAIHGFIAGEFLQHRTLNIDYSNLSATLD